jgi:hypothetical protein
MPVFGITVEVPCQVEEIKAATLAPGASTGVAYLRLAEGAIGCFYIVRSLSINKGLDGKQAFSTLKSIFDL